MNIKTTKTTTTMIALLLAMLFIGTKLVFRYKTNNAAIGLGMVGVWLAALVALIVISAGQIGHFKSRSSLTENQNIFFSRSPK